MAKRSNGSKLGRAIVAVVALSLSGCMAAIPSVDVTRFFNGPTVPKAGAIAIAPADPRDAGSLEFRTAANAVSAALTRTGFAVVDEKATNAAFQAVVEVRRETVEPSRERRSPVSVGVGGSTGSYGSGVGVGLGIDLSGKPKPVVTTQLRVQIRKAGDNQAVWEGRAETSAKQGSPAAQPGIAAGKLADALFRQYPGESGKTVTVQ
ncbi:MAG: DUF4136 domain-containing protein [Sphingobium sp.]|nr:DUF4136 domain-containing protein [Sphingobium sp.]